jgi:translation initiation factor IF-2
MRSRGAQVADVIILVVAANEGVELQTKECLKHIEATGIPFVVAINKIDLPEADVNRTKASLAEAGVLVEGYGGKVPVVEVSAKTGEGVKELLEMVVLLAEMQEIKAEKTARLAGVVLEARKEAQGGVVVSLLVQDGCLRRGGELELAGEKVKVKRLTGEKGQVVEVAEPGQVVEVWGLTKLPEVGVKIGEKVRPEVKAGERTVTEGEEQKQVKVILKADGGGTLEAITGCLSDEVAVVEKGVGPVNDSEIWLAKSVGAEVISFGVKVPTGVGKLAEMEGVKIRSFEIIYELLQYLEKRVLRLLQPDLNEEILGRAEIVAEFAMREGHVAGARVTEGEISRAEKIRVQRGEAVIGEARLKSLKKNKMDAAVVKKGEEFGAILVPGIDFTIGDVVISYRHGSD